MNRVLPTLVMLSLMALVVQTKITCRDNNNEPVEWYIVYKLPVKFNLSASSHWPFPPHLYMDSNNNQFNKSTLNLNATSQSVAYTLQQAYGNHLSNNVGYILYNDEKPTQAGGGYTEDYGHTKGVTIFDKDSGIWLVHSVPKFPPPTNSSYMYPDNAVYYGQHLMCIQLNTAKDVSHLGNLLMYNEPWIYDHNLPTLLGALYPSMADVIAEVRTNTTNYTLNLDTPTTGSFFTVFAKNSKFNADLYADLVAPTLASNFSTETWQHGTTENLPSACDQTYTVHNIEAIAMKSFGVSFHNYFDHSKFAVSENSTDVYSKHYVCIGDVNRQKHQMVRGGGTVCFSNLKVHSQYMSMIAKLEQCPSQ